MYFSNTSIPYSALLLGMPVHTCMEWYVSRTSFPPPQSASHPPPNMAFNSCTQWDYVISWIKLFWQSGLMGCLFLNSDTCCIQLQWCDGFVHLNLKLCFAWGEATHIYTKTADQGHTRAVPGLFRIMCTHITRTQRKNRWEHMHAQTYV